MSAPLARVAPVRDTYFDVTIEDPYRWMEDMSAEFQSWVDGQAEYARIVLDALPGRGALLTRIRALRGGTPERFGFAHAGGRTFLLRHDPGWPVPLLVTAAGDGVVEDVDRVLLDPATLDSAATAAGSRSGLGGPHSYLDWFVPSPDGRYVACGISRGGNEFQTLRVIEVATGAMLDDAVTNMRLPFVSWLEDNASFTCFRYRDPPPDATPETRRLDSHTVLHRLGDDPAQDTAVLARGLNPTLPLAPLDRPKLVRPRGSPWLLAVITHTAVRGATDEGLANCSLFVGPLAGLADPASIAWVRVAEPTDGVTAYALGADTLYLVARGRTPMGRVLAMPLADPVPARAAILVPESEREIEAVRVAGTHLLVRELDVGVARLRRVPLTDGPPPVGTDPGAQVSGGAPEEVPLPVDGTIMEWSDSMPDGSVLLRIESWTSAPHVDRYEPASGTIVDAGGPSATAEGFADIHAYRILAPARDGTPIPLTVMHHRDVARDGTHRTILAGYGAYGISFTPQYLPGRLAWLERGGIYVVAHLRGGGEHGPAWHDAGRGLRKETTITDFIDCAEHLIAEGFTTSARLVGSGGSAGGIPTGGALVRRPDLWAVMVMHVPVGNALRVEFSENGPVNIPENGSVATEDGLRSLLISDALHRVVDGTAYPAVYFTAGRNDSRVALWQPAKLTARLQAATSSDRPVLLRVEEHGGHGLGSTTDQRDTALADEYAFLFHETGSTAPE